MSEYGEKTSTHIRFNIFYDITQLIQLSVCVVGRPVL